VANAAKKYAISGLEFLHCIPGTIGGGTVGNAGCYGRDYSDILVSIRTINRQGNVKIYSKDDCKLSYRNSEIPNDEIIVSITLQGTICAEITSEKIEKIMNEMMNKKSSSQPIWERCAGSTFKNPDTKFAWQLISESGADKLTKGDAKTSSKHANFLINSGSASSSDIEDLGEEIRRIVYEKTGTMLHWEIKILGDR
jgi:UDP-N-acetylmuramate dehydrogenase